MLTRTLTLTTVLTLASLTAGCDKPAPPTPEAPEAAQESEAPAPKVSLTAPLPKGKLISPTLVVGGQPTKAHLEEMAASGLTTVVNLKTEGEMTFDEAAEAKRLGLTYIAMPMAGKKGLTDKNAARLDEVLKAGEPTLVHCQSGNRVGALFALHAQKFKGASTEEAMTIGLSHGMTRLKGPVRELLEVKAERGFAKDAQEKVGLFKAALGAELKAALKAGGPAKAISVCAEKAPEIAAKMSDDTLSIRRVGTRVRNTKTNTPTHAMNAVMKGLTPDKPVHLGVIDGKETAVHGLFIQNPVCLSCHGPKGSLAPEVTAALAEQYPDDAAVGYAMGDLRGAVVVERR
ncbi:MAG: c-type heme family protein [Myxococcota bacterium]